MIKKTASIFSALAATGLLLGCAKEPPIPETSIKADPDSCVSRKIDQLKTQEGKVLASQESLDKSPESLHYTEKCVDAKTLRFAVAEHYKNVIAPWVRRALNDPEQRKSLVIHLREYMGLYGKTPESFIALHMGFAEDGIDPATIAYPVLRDDIAGYIDRLIDENGKYDEGARLKLIHLWNHGEPAWNISAGRAKREIRQLFSTQPALTCVTALEGNKLNVESVYGTMEEILAGTPIGGKKLVRKGNFLWCVDKGGDGAPKISMLIPPGALKKTIYHNIAAGLENWQPGEKFELVFG